MSASVKFFTQLDAVRHCGAETITNMPHRRWCQPSIKPPVERVSNYEAAAEPE
jgi:hypothetical protein